MNILDSLRQYLALKFQAFTFTLKIDQNGKKILEDLPESWQFVTHDKCDALAKNPNLGHNAIAIRTGVESNLLALDLDNKNGVNGLDAINRLGVVIPGGTPCVRSQSGGFHYYFSFPLELAAKSTFAFPDEGFDIRGEKGLIIAPPTQIENVGKYEWVTPIQDRLPLPPKTLIDYLRAARKEIQEAQMCDGQLSFEELSFEERALLTAMAETCNRALVGTRSEKDFTLVCNAIRFNLSKDAIRRFVIDKGKFLEMEQAGHFDDYFAITYKNAYSSVRGSGTNKTGSAAQVIDAQGKESGVGLIDGYLATDGGRARRLFDRYGKSIIHVEGTGRMVFTGKIWESDRGQVYGYFKTLSKEIWQRATAMTFGEKDSAKNMLSESKALDTKKKMDEALGLLPREYENKIKVDDLDTNPYLLNAQNGTVDLKTGTLLPFDAGNKITKIISCNYDPAAKAAKWESFLEKIQPSPESRAFLQRFLGYAITGRVSERCIGVFYGTGKNGKTVLVEVISRILLEYAGKAPRELLLPRKPGTIPNDLAFLRGLRFVSTSEINEGSRFDEAFIKEMTGGDTLTARYLHKEFFQFAPRFKLLLLTNHKPKIPTGDQALWDRLILVPFNVRIQDKEVRPFEDLVTDLLSESKGILAWLAEGTQMWIKQGLNPPEAIRDATKEYMGEEDYIGQFIEENCELGNTFKTPLTPLYSIFQKWEQECGIRYPISRNQFSRRMEEKGYRKSRNNEGNILWGLQLKGTLSVEQVPDFLRMFDSAKGEKPSTEECCKQDFSSCCN